MNLRHSATLKFFGFANFQGWGVVVGFFIAPSLLLFGRQPAAAALCAILSAGSLASGLAILSRRPFARLLTFLVAAAWLVALAWHCADDLAFPVRRLLDVALATFAVAYWLLCVLVVANPANRTEFTEAQ